MLKTVSIVGAASVVASAVGVLGSALPSNAATLDLSSCGATITTGCVVGYTGGTATIQVTQSSNPVAGTPTGNNATDDLIMGVNAPGSAFTAQTVKITFASTGADPTPNLGVTLLPPATTGAFGDYRDNWQADLMGATWSLSDPGPQDLSQQYPLASFPAPTSVFPTPLGTILPAPVAGGSSISWSHPYSLSTKRARVMDWSLVSSGPVSMLTLTYFSSVPLSETTANFNNADALRIDVTPVPEPLTVLGAGTAVGFGAFFKRRLAKNQKKEG